ncbi:holo-ACP synthase [Marinilactibacillus kalidii]|uniref:holo-ACP synthase n=1 Tax=Marinilactibacillus kalidii TaxID=2820274 RepID=UPI001ABED961|nr:holo-ACP synthase [Marinilactibacillus kalidii]
MIVGIGLDIVDISRISEASEKRESFPSRVLTQNELQVYEKLKGTRRDEFLAGRFSAKEAFSKALGTGIGKVGFHDIEILNSASGKPEITLSPFAGNAWVTITHTNNVAAAQVILEKTS